MTRALSLSLVMAGAAAAALAQSSFARHGIDALDYHSPGFADALAAHIGRENAASIAELQPFTFLIRNRAAVPIYKVSVRYPGGLIPFLTALAPGAATVLTPDTLLNELLNRRPPEPPNVILGRVLAFRDSFHERFDPLRFPPRPTTLDLVIFSDGRCLGPDSGGEIETESARYAIEDEFLALLRDPALTDLQLQAKLSAISQLPPPSNRYRSGLARALSDGLRNNGRAASITFLERVVRGNKPPAPSLRRID